MQPFPPFRSAASAKYELCATKSPKTCRAAKLLKRLYVHQTNVSDFELLALECLVITVAPLGIVCPCGTLRTCSSSALSIFDEQKLFDKHLLQASWAFTSGLNLMITTGDISLYLPLLKKKKFSVNLELICIYLTYLPYQLQAPLVAQAT